jgi:molybdopterin molybdotransferase
VIALQKAYEYVLRQVAPLGTTTMSIGEAAGYTLASDVVSSENVPPFANSAVDGYAVQAADTAGAPVILRVIGRIAAGENPTMTLAAGETIRIMTGAVMPAGADAIVMVEDSEVIDETSVRLSRAVASGDALRPVGDDVKVGQVVLTAGTELRPMHIGVLASIGQMSVEVFRKPVIGVLSTGDELVDGGGSLQPGQIRESNRTTLAAMARQAGFEVIDLGLAVDTNEAIVAALQRGMAQCDAICTSGGVSMGDFDLIKVVLDEMGDMRWMQMAIKPAKPFAFGTLPGPNGPVAVFGLPGNPVSSMVSFELLARPALRKMAGHVALDRPSVLALCDEPIRRKPDGKTHIVRTHGAFGSDGRWHIRTTGEQGSHQLANSADANGFAIVPDGSGLAAGDEVMVTLLN